MSFPDRGTLLDLLAGTAGTLALFLAYVALPLVGMLPGVLAPLPGMFYSLKRGWWAGLTVVALSAAGIALVSDLPAVVLYLLQCGAMTVLLPLWLGQGQSGSRALLQTVAVNALLILVGLAIVAVSRDVDPHALVIKGIQESIAQTATLYQKGGIAGDDLQALQQGMAQAGVLIGRIYPALVLLGLACLAAFNLGILQRLTRRLPQPLVLEPFTGFRNPDFLVWGLIAAGFALLVPVTPIRTVALNILALALFLYFVQGLAVVMNLLQRYAVPPLVRWVVYILLGLQPYLMVAVVLLGLFDLWGDFRTPKSKNL